MHIFGVGGDQSTQHKCKQTEHADSPQKGSVFCCEAKEPKQSVVMYSNDPAQ